jgi:O-antigen/teichoic acid export membrane protein
VILAFGQLINVLFGPVGILLNMTGHERDTMRGLTMAAVLNVLLSLTLIPMFGINGAAIASAITLVICNVLLWKSVRKRLDIQSAILMKPRGYED